MEDLNNFYPQDFGSTGDIASGSLCKNGHHVFTYAGAYGSDRIPEGLRCSCGMFVAHYTRCWCCGQERTELWPVKWKEEEGDERN